MPVPYLYAFYNLSHLFMLMCTVDVYRNNVYCIVRYSTIGKGKGFFSCSLIFWSKVREERILILRKSLTMTLLTPLSECPNQLNSTQLNQHPTNERREFLLLLPLASQTQSLRCQGALGTNGTVEELQHYSTTHATFMNAMKHHCADT